MPKVYFSKLVAANPYRADKRVTYFSPYVPVSQDEQVNVLVLMHSGVRINPDIYYGVPSGT